MSGVRLVSRELRVVEVLGPELPRSRRPTDRRQAFWRSNASRDEFMVGPQPVAHCFQADGRKAKFLVDRGAQGDALLDLLASRPQTPARPARPDGVNGWLVEA